MESSETKVREPGSIKTDQTHPKPGHNTADIGFEQRIKGATKDSSVPAPNRIDSGNDMDGNYVRLASGVGGDIEEGLDAYNSLRGFHPVHIGDTYGEKYIVVSKIGYGYYSTVWLVQDQRKQEFFALKITAAECYEATNFLEKKVLLTLMQGDQTHPGRNHVTQLIDSFEHDGPNGTHYCFIFELMGESLVTFGTWFKDCMVPERIMHRFTIQLLLALAYAHDHGIIHTDVKPANILVKMKDSGRIESDYLPGVRSLYPSNFIPPNSSEPYKILHSHPLKWAYCNFKDINEIFNLDVVLADWGTAYYTADHHYEVIQPPKYRSPEVLIGASWDPSTDLWTLGCTILEVFRAVRMFSGRTLPDGKYKKKQHLSEMLDFFGPFPRSLLDRGDQKLVKELFDDDGRIKDGWSFKRQDLDSEVFVPGLKEERRHVFVAFLRALMKLDPKDRLSIMDLLAEPWLDAVKKN